LSLSAEPVIERVVRVEPLPVGIARISSFGVRMSDGIEREALLFYETEILFSEGDLIGLAQAACMHASRGWTTTGD
jgi:hypothetical protein